MASNIGAMQLYSFTLDTSLNEENKDIQESICLQSLCRFYIKATRFF